VMLTKIISGAQTGADRAGLDVALDLGLDVGGTVPKGRRTDDGPLTDDEMKKYKLVEHSSSAYPPRTAENVRNSDGTVLFGRMGSPGCKLTIRLCVQFDKPYLVNPNAQFLREWVEYRGIKTLNVAGNRERKNPGIYQLVNTTLWEAFRG
jgi:hypothetical protein